MPTNNRTSSSRGIVHLLVLAVIAVIVLLLLFLWLNYTNTIPLSKKFPAKFGFLPHQAGNLGKEVRDLKQTLYYQKDQDALKQIPVPDIAKTIAQYISSQKRNDGYYEYLAHYDVLCTIKDGKKQCPLNNERMFQTTNTWTGLAYYSTYKILNDQKYLKLARDDYAKLFDYCKSDPSKCKYVIAQPAIIYQDMPDEQFKAFINQEADALVKATPSTNAMLANIEVRELALASTVLKTDSYLTEAKKRFVTSTKITQESNLVYKTDTKSNHKISACWNILAGIEIAKASKNTGAVTSIRQQLAELDVNGNYLYVLDPVEFQPCIESYFSLYQLSGKKDDYDKGVDLLYKFLRRFWDTKDNRLIYGEGGTIFNVDQSTADGRGKGFVVLTDSSYTSYLLLLSVL